ncbi:uncharacterized protein CELE_B0250.18 [Caenorhabditis elegans]|uniref:Uncharacterized protein n=1 Tax=Caenorhabditis elegans TaxID=6239 RepID=G1K0Y4_CAEEL|nr:Uncharacterized protein CELE_B0250.18 [Caenorhabditis elegans]CCC42148.1 Uncharacterized protein CELE_B0250.18 [Caenorhabditis elegans]|eukprot:NP_001256922.1 Uncharacterized protein CELE_B0250.18 [Caenorhabditis elegans]
MCAHFYNTTMNGCCLLNRRLLAAKNFETVEDLEDHEFDRNAEGHPNQPVRIYG